MASQQELEIALRNADAAGDVDAARILAAEISKAPVGQNVAADVAKSAGIGLAKGGIGLAGLPGDIGSLLQTGANYVGIPENVQGSARTMARAIPGGSMLRLPGSADIQKSVEGFTGEFYKPQTVAGEYAQTGAEFLPAAAMGPGGLARRLAMQVAAPAIGSETAGQATKGTAAEPYARAAGALAAPFAVSGAARTVTPFPASPERQRLAQILNNEGVNLTAGKTTGSRPLRWMESVQEDTPMVAGRARQMAEREHEQFTGAILARAGENATRATPQVVDRAFTRIGQSFDDLAARNQAVADQQLATDVRGALDEYYNLVSPPNRTPAVTNYVQELVTAAQRNNNVIPGEVYQSLRSRMERAARGLGNNPEARAAIREIRHAIDDAMERSIQNAGNVNDLALWREARNQYRNMLVIERAATGAGENAAQGLISPSQLRNAVVNQGRRAYARGEGDFADLARAGEALMKPLPQSGTAPRLGAMSGFGAAAGGAAGSGFGPLGTVAGALAGMVLPAAWGHTLLSLPVQRYLGNQAVQRLTPGRAAMSPLAIANALRPAIGQ